MPRQWHLQSDLHLQTLDEPLARLDLRLFVDVLAPQAPVLARLLFAPGFGTLYMPELGPGFGLICVAGPVVDCGPVVDYGHEAGCCPVAERSDASAAVRPSGSLVAASRLPRQPAPSWRRGPYRYGS